MAETREDVLREFAPESNPGSRVVLTAWTDKRHRAMADEIVRLRAKLQAVREAAEHLMGYSIVADGPGYRPDAMSYVTASEFHEYATATMREILAELGEP